MRTNGNGRSEEIQREIAATRSDMDHTLSEIQGRFTPGQLLDQGLDYVRGSGANEYVHNLGHSVKANPIPVALVGIGLAWLMASNRKHTSHDVDLYLDSSSSGSRLADAKEHLSSGAQGLQDRISSGSQDMKDRLSSGTQGMKDRISAGTQGMKQRAGQARESISGKMHAAKDGVSRTAEGARHQIDRAREGFDWMLREQPLALGAIGVAVGALLAAAAPRTRTEDELMGEKRDELMDRAKEAGREQVEKVKNVAGEAVSAAKDAASEAASRTKTEAQRQGMTSPDKPSPDPFARPSSNTPLISPLDSGTPTPPPPSARPSNQPRAGEI